MTHPPQPGQEGYGTSGAETPGTGQGHDKAQGHGQSNDPVQGYGQPDEPGPSHSQGNNPAPGNEQGGDSARGYGPGYDPVQSYWSGAPPQAIGVGAYVPQGYAPSGTGYPPADVGYPAPGIGYPAPGVGYPAPGYGYGAPYGYLNQGMPMGRATDGMAIASLVLSCFAALGLCAWGVGGLLFGTLGAVFGHVAKSRIRKSGAGGDGMALAGIIVGWIAAALGLIAVGLFVFFLATADSTNY
jgi:hypothetical protein